MALIVIGMLLAVLYAVFNGFSEKLAARLQNHAVLAAVLAGALLGLVGFFVPETMFSGETGLHALLGDWRSYTAGALLLIAVLKGLLSALCINLGWRGGNIFPIIYMGAAAGYACAQAVNLLGGDAALDGGFAVALVLAAMYGFLSQKPVTGHCCAAALLSGDVHSADCGGSIRVCETLAMAQWLAEKNSVRKFNLAATFL